jgi:hypothetical protein
MLRVLVDDDLVLTASHCVDALVNCESQLWAFDYAIAQAGAPLQIEARDLYRCRSVPIQTHKFTTDGSAWTTRSFSSIALNLLQVADGGSQCRLTLRAERAGLQGFGCAKFARDLKSVLLE